MTPLTWIPMLKKGWKQMYHGKILLVIVVSILLMCHGLRRQMHTSLGSSCPGKIQSSGPLVRWVCKVFRPELGNKVRRLAFLFSSPRLVSRWFIWKLGNLIIRCTNIPLSPLVSLVSISAVIWTLTRKAEISWWVTLMTILTAKSCFAIIFEQFSLYIPQIGLNYVDGLAFQLIFEGGKWRPCHNWNTQLCSLLCAGVWTTQSIEEACYRTLMWPTLVIW